MVFSPYFSVRPESQFSAQHWAEARNLEERRDISQLEKKRLWDLYQIEKKWVKEGSPRYVELGARLEALKADVEEFNRESERWGSKLAAIADTAASEDSAKAPLETEGLKKSFEEARRLWNRDENEEALAKISSVLTDEALKARAKESEWYRATHLKFRILLDLGRLEDAERAYLELKALQGCSTDTAEAAFLLSVYSFAEGNVKRATQVFFMQCDPDRSPSNEIRRKYWLARFSEGEGSVSPNVPSKSQALYEEILRSRLPGYYVYLTKSRLGRKIEISKAEGVGARPYLETSFKVPRDVHSLLVNAEERLRANLKKDASRYLHAASQLLKRNVVEKNVLPLLYIAHLLQASGSQLEAMKIYGLITTAFQEDSSAVKLLPLGFLDEMFPRPFNPSVEWLCRLWKNDPDFIYAIMRQESAFNPAAVSGADARGLMQLMPSLARQLAERWNYRTYYHDRLLFHAEENLKLATFHLHELKSRVPHPVLIIASYNAGLQRVFGWWRRFGHLPLDAFIEVIPVAETRIYVKLVLRNYLYYRALRNGGNADSTIIPAKLPVFDESLLKLSFLRP